MKVSISPQNKPYETGVEVAVRWWEEGAEGVCTALDLATI